MSGEIGRLINRNGRDFARLVVPAELRSQIGKSELRAGLGADRRTALRKLPLAAAGLQDVIADARRRPSRVPRSSDFRSRSPRSPTASMIGLERDECRERGCRLRASVNDARRESGDPRTRESLHREAARQESRERSIAVTPAPRLELGQPIRASIYPRRNCRCRTHRRRVGDRQASSAPTPSRYD